LALGDRLAAFAAHEVAQIAARQLGDHAERAVSSAAMISGTRATAASLHSRVPEPAVKARFDPRRSSL
jgi:hypothetical protein